MKLAWTVAALSSLVATGASIAAQRPEVPTGLADGLFLGSVIIGTAAIVGLHARYRSVIGSWFGGTQRLRIHVLAIGDIAVILLALQIFSAGLALSLMTAAIFTHSIDRAFQHESVFGERARAESNRERELAGSLA